MDNARGGGEEDTALTLMAKAGAVPALVTAAQPKSQAKLPPVQQSQSKKPTQKDLMR